MQVCASCSNYRHQTGGVARHRKVNKVPTSPNPDQRWRSVSPSTVRRICLFGGIPLTSDAQSQ